MQGTGRHLKLQIQWLGVWALKQTICVQTSNIKTNVLLPPPKAPFVPQFLPLCQGIKIKMNEDRISKETLVFPLVLLLYNGKSIFKSIKNIILMCLTCVCGGETTKTNNCMLMALFVYNFQLYQISGWTKRLAGSLVFHWRALKASRPCVI